MVKLGGSIPRLALVAAALVLILLNFYIYLPQPVLGNGNSRISNDGCEWLTGLERVVITVKTGATEASQKIPVQMRTSLRCAPHVLVFSDMAQRIGDIELHDVLGDTADEVKDGNPAFEIYRKQQELKDPEEIHRQLKSFKTPGTNEAAAWTLDKYKNMHLVEKAWALRPDMDWYLHVDADTYVMLPSLAAWLKRLDKKKHLYLGRSIPVDGITFGHGGSGILLSGEAMRMFAVDNVGTAARWDPIVNSSCCGDLLLSRALWEIGIPRVLHAWPSINGESPTTMPFGEQQWCEPIVTMHHVTAEEMSAAAKFEKGRPDMSKPVLFEEFFKGVSIQDYPEHKKHWDNLGLDHWDNMAYGYTSPGTILKDIKSADACNSLCAKDERCFQSRFDGSECTVLDTGFVVGKERNPTGNSIWDSYWNATRIDKWVARQQLCASTVKFPHELHS
ncbi:glycosyltransferase family 31 protein [Oidiodendron maius Zn]|uniref:N-acetylgalactosaminide beta-1,3-galactosyltransferase n=1 Tax=Oidiodendron maius (strain Zn) TaxID=913774 RepID=A0A0C3GNN4_OIDMZ|nr:glycosyltransferase family 31 protein [Oidiodendron maius Zn]